MPIKRIGELNNNWRGGIKEKTCQFCGLQFKSGYQKRKYCSQDCSQKSKTGIKRNLTNEQLIAIREGIKKRDVNRVNKKYYCECGNEKKRKNVRCKDCRDKLINHLYKTCPNCDCKFKAKNYIQTFCSKKCFKINLQFKVLSEENPNWKGGMKSSNQIGRYSVIHREWIRKVFERDNYTCQHCGQIGDKLNAHHIKQWAKHKSKRFELSNGITLCVVCHRKEHNWKTKSNI
jgi:hypothetical protein